MRSARAKPTCNALPEWAGRRLDTVGVPVFGVAGRLAVDLAKPLQLVEGHILVAGQIEQAVEQHRGVAVRQHEPVAVEPVWISRIELHEIPEENGRDVGHAHGRARMTAFGPLHRVHGKKPYAVGHIPQVLVAGLGNCLDGRNGRHISHDCRFLFREIDRGRRLAQASRAPKW